MNNHIKLCDVLARLDENKMSYQLLELENNCKIVVTQYGGRVLGPFAGEKGESLSWLNGALADSGKFQDFLNKKAWNLGGDRYWIAPEHPLFVKERDAFHETYCVPKELDPGNYVLSAIKKTAELKQTVRTRVYESTVDVKEFRILHRIMPLKNPLKELPGTDSLKIGFCGYEHEFTLEEISEPVGFSLEPWNLLQVNPGGKVIFPYTGDFAFVDYYEPIDQKVMAVHEGYAELTLSGYRRYKAAFYALNTLGRAAYINKNTDGYYLIYKQYYNDPCNPYCCDPWDKPGQKGCSLSVYNDDGSSGGYGEFENSGLTIGAGTDRVKSATNLSHMFFTGEKEELEKLVTVLLGIRYRIDF
jgi:hypothetical protein